MWFNCVISILYNNSYSQRPFARYPKSDDFTLEYLVPPSLQTVHWGIDKNWPLVQLFGKEVTHLTLIGWCQPFPKNINSSFLQAEQWSSSAARSELGLKQSSQTNTMAIILVLITFFPLVTQQNDLSHSLHGSLISPYPRHSSQRWYSLHYSPPMSNIHHMNDSNMKRSRDLDNSHCATRKQSSTGHTRQSSL